MLNTLIKYHVALHSIRNAKNNNQRNMLIHHGLMGSSKNFRNISRAPPISSHCDTFLIDARNHGESPHTKTHTIADLADDLFQYIETNHLSRPGPKLTLMGHSMGGLALIQFTKRYCSPEIQQLIDRVIIIDIPADPVSNYPSFTATGEMLKRFWGINLAQPLKLIHEEIERCSTTKDVAALIKTNLVKVSQNEYRWIVNLQLLAYEGYENIGNYSLAEENHKNWHKPVEFIYGQKSSYYDKRQHELYVEFYPQMRSENFHCIKKAGHWVHADNPSEFLEVVERILHRDRV